ncbi:hypothetical protein K227x_63020 [Rubripirellula lacrimiformis]|uniref:Integral membrane protein n=2 Tax=Rubripirellula lacrimiformis TaxID=1930273 RepID=A0A517NLC9_9BACT|nr:hypothetical protein K227x_63020 [Rubripirellula lacrimiformis]
MAIPAMLLIGLMVIGVFQSANDDSSGKSSAMETDAGATAASKIRLDEARLVESSGLARSHHRDDAFWTHNDSGSKPELFAFDLTGRRLVRLRFPSIRKAIDWEDMASFVDDGVPRLLIADTGDNKGVRSTVSLHLCDEPGLDDDKQQADVQTIQVAFPDGPHDCEAVAVDVQRRLIVMLTKSGFPLCRVYAIPIPHFDDGQSIIQVQATAVTTLAMPMVTAADFDSATGDLWVINYFQAFRFAGTDPATPLSKMLAALPTAMDLPRLRQIEAMAVGPNSQVWVTSEGTPAWMQKVSQPGR